MPVGIIVSVFTNAIMGLRVAISALTGLIITFHKLVLVISSLIGTLYLIGWI